MKLYADRDASALDDAGGYYFRHVMAMTAEGLHSKSQIACELGYRDMLLAEAKEVIMQARTAWLYDNDPQDGTDVVTPYDTILYKL